MIKLSQIVGDASHRLKDLAGNRRGNIAIMFALLAVPTVGMLGLSVDLSRLLAVRSAAQGAADSAALFAVKVIKQSTTADKGSLQNVTALIAEAERRAKDQFDAMLSDDRVSSSVKVERNGSQFLATVSYDVTIETTFSRVLGRDTMTASSFSQTLSTMPLFSDVSLLLDISQSMGLASTTEGAKILFAATKAYTGKGCVFGCHVSTFKNKVSNSVVAGNNGVKMRVDVLREATTNMIERAKSSAGDNSFYRFGLYTMSYNFIKLAALSDNLTSVKTKAASIDLGYNDTSGFGDTDYQANIPKLLPYVIANGDGLSQSTAKQYVFIVTDGVRDTKGNCTSGHCTSAIDPTVCQGFKDKGATVGVIYTTFLPVLEDPFSSSGTLQGDYKALVAPFASQIGPALQQCASPDWFFEASNASGIHDAMTKMFNQIERPPTLTR